MIDDNGHWRPYDYEREEIFDDYDPASDPARRVLDQMAMFGFLLIWVALILFAVSLFQNVRGGG